ncbi:HmuY family protein, partial [Bacteroidota bacterium]
FQAYFDLGTNSTVSQHSKMTWDLAFESSDTGYIIMLNNARFMKIVNTGTTDFYTGVFDTTGADWKFDNVSAFPDSSAIGNWADIIINPIQSYNLVYALDLGMDDEGNQLGFRKIQFVSYSDSFYFFRYAMLDGGQPDSFYIKKDQSKNFSYFSFKNGGQQLIIEPDKDKWDLLFTQYTTILYTDLGEAVPYLVLGVLQNPDRVEAAVLKNSDFNSVVFDQVITLPYSRKQDVIGYEWKKYNFSSGIYEVTTTNTYIIKDTDGFLYKLRFISFYNAQGDKGYPNFEVQKL